MSRVYTCQLLCPDRHCVVGAAYMEGDNVFVEEALRNGMSEAKFKWECFICLSQDLKFEHGPTRFTSLEEATPAMMEIQERNLQTRMIVELLRKHGEEDLLGPIRNGQEVPESIQKRIVEIIQREMEEES